MLPFCLKLKVLSTFNFILSTKKAQVAELVDALDLKSNSFNMEWEFDSPPGHHPSLKLRMAKPSLSHSL